MFRFFVLLIVVSGCAEAKPPAPANPSSTTLAGQPSTQPAAHEPVVAPVAADLAGAWAQYWAPGGCVDTQRYVFLEDGRFGWLAPERDTKKMDPLQRSGQFELHDGALVLHVQRERFAPCGEGCAHHDQPNVQEHAPPLTITLEVGDCPMNQEAEQVDASYRCRSIGGMTFWRRKLEAAGDPQKFFE